MLVTPPDDSMPSRNPAFLVFIGSCTVTGLLVWLAPPWTIMLFAAVGMFLGGYAVAVGQDMRRRLAFWALMMELAQRYHDDPAGEQVMLDVIAAAQKAGIAD